MRIYQLNNEMDVLLHKLGINSSTAYFKHASAALKTIAKDAEEVPTATLTLGLSSGVAVALDKEHYLHVAPDRTEVVPNGKEVLFRPMAAPWVYAESTERDLEGFLVAFINSLLPIPNDLTSKLILSAVLTALTDANAPILLFTGAPGAGKTTVIECLLWLIYGPQASVHRIPSKESDLTVTLDQERILGLDNLEDAPEWFHDVVCIAVTGGSQVRRKLYTDKQSVRFTLKNLLLLSAVDPASIYRADVLSRMLVIECVKATALKSGADLRSRVLKNRDAVLSALLDLARVHMHVVRVAPAHRLVDWHHQALCLGISASDIQTLIDGNDAKSSDRLPLVDVMVLYKNLIAGPDHALPDSGIMLHSSLQQILSIQSQQSALKHVPDTWRKMARQIRQHASVFERECGLRVIEKGKNLEIQWITSVI